MINLMRNHLWIRLFGIYLCVIVCMFIIHEALFVQVEYLLSPFSEYGASIVFRACNLLVLLLFIQQFHRHCNGISLTETTFMKGCDHREVLRYGLLGMIALLLVAGLMMYLGVSEHKFNGFSVQNIVQLLILLFISATFEQTLINGLFFTTLSKTMWLGFALFLTGVLFCYLHLDNQNYSVLAAINTFLAGCLFGAIYARTQSIWPAIAFHFCWNTTQSLLLGFNVSGNTFDSIMKTHLSGHSLVNGGHYGPEGSILTTVVNLGLILVLTNALLFNQTKKATVSEHLAAQ